MSWSQITFVVDANNVERLSSMLEAFLAQAITTENAGEDEFYEVAFPGTPDWQKVRVTALFDNQVDLNPIIEFVGQQFTGDNHTELPVEVTTLVDQDWQRVWLSSFKPIQVGKELWVCPSWCEPVEPNQKNIILDPGLAFGTGTHATTAMSLQWLSEHSLTQKTVLDYGSGSGILAIGALLCGAAKADAVDIDPLAVAACKENAERNHCQKQLQAYLPAQLSKENTYNLVIANILADVIIELRDTLLLHLQSDGVLLLTGILENQVDKVKNAFYEYYNFDVRVQDQWCLLVSKPKQ